MRQTTCQPIFAIGIAQFCSLEIEYGYDPGYDYYDHVSSTITGRRTGTFGVGSRCATFAFDSTSVALAVPGGPEDGGS